MEELERRYDNRRLIEAAAGELVAEYASSGEVCDALYDGIIGLLDRQAALTKREVRLRQMKEDLWKNSKDS